MSFARGPQTILQIMVPGLLRQIKKPMPIQMSWWAMVRTFLLLIALAQVGPVTGKTASIEIPCVEFSSAINVPCLCSLNEVNATRINCDNVVFPGDFPVLPLRYYIQEFSQKNVGWQLLPTQIFTASDIPLKIVDFSHNSMRRLAERLFDGMEDTLEEIYLSHNMLGDNLNPVFSTDEFKNLKDLRVLDLSYNGLSGISENLIDGCDELKVSENVFFVTNIVRISHYTIQLSKLENFELGFAPNFPPEFLSCLTWPKEYQLSFYGVAIHR